jgi:glucosamine--fructose-6-phosphate aminotransferase (isomerizing)
LAYRQEPEVFIMCGIVGYVGKRQATGILLESLKRLEYRGYDSAGIVVQNGHGLACEKRAGRISNLEAGCKRRSLHGRAGIGHTRWATHGGVTSANAHPHLCCEGKIAVVHNGIVENYAELRAELEACHKFNSQTDTEAIPHLIEDLYRSNGGDLLRAVNAAVDRIRGSFAIAVIHADHPNNIAVARVNCPIVVGLGEGESFVASDIPALLPYTRKIIPLEENELASIGLEGIQIFDRHLNPKSRRPLRITWSADAVVKNDGHAHFMVQEIHAQAQTLAAEVDAWDQGLHDIKLAKDLERVQIVGCGSAMHAGLVGKAAIEELARVPVEVTAASELRYGDPLFNEKTLVIAISQSGETADTLASVRAASEAGSTVLAITNVNGSTLAREADMALCMRAGPEVGVAATKTYTSQVLNAILIAMRLGKERGTLSPERFEALMEDARKLSGHVERILARDTLVRACARKYQEGFGFMFIGRRYNLATAMEAALKMKEITYHPAEGLAAGEMKHGPLALIDDRTVCVAIAPHGRANEKMISNIQEVRARGGAILSIATEGDAAVASVSDHCVEIPACEEIFSPILSVIPLQLLAYFRAVGLGRDVDRPRNLAKSVTVE